MQPRSSRPEPGPPPRHHFGGKGPTSAWRLVAFLVLTLAAMVMLLRWSQQ